MLDLLQSERSRHYLICAARHPLVSSSKLWDELLLYNLNPAAQTRLAALFEKLTGKSITADSPVNTLSGGQKVMLMCLLALLSPAPRILFLDLWHSLDTENRSKVQQLLSEFGQGREILFEDSSDAD